MTNVWLPPMNASEVMTKQVLSVGPDTPPRAVAKLLLDKSISAVPVVDTTGLILASCGRRRARVRAHAGSVSRAQTSFSQSPWPSSIES